MQIDGPAFPQPPGQVGDERTGGKAGGKVGDGSLGRAGPVHQVVGAHRHAHQPGFGPIE